MDLREWFTAADPVAQALAAGLFTWSLTALGAAAVFMTRDLSQRALDTALGFTAGVMMAASFWSLLAPAIALAEEMGMVPWVPAVVGFIAGGAFLRLSDHLLPHLHLFQPLADAEGISTTWRKSVLLVLAITLHNFPEGLAVGVAFGAVAAGHEGATLASAIALAIGIGLQNFPEGTAVAVPLRREGLSRFKSWWYGQLSAAVEPLAAVVGATAVVLMRPVLPYALAFAAGAMIFVVVEEVVPESQAGGHADSATLGAMVGFAVMMTLDVALG
ncbi:MAG: ZIP family metal transporter [Vicinamibacterales bacterium]